MQRAGTSRPPPPRGNRSPGLGPQRTRRAQAPPHTLPATSSSSSSRALPPTSSPDRAHSATETRRRGEPPPDPGPLAPGSGGVFLARGPHSLICAPSHLLHTVKKEFSTPCPPPPWPGRRNRSCQPPPGEAGPSRTHPEPQLRQHERWALRGPGSRATGRSPSSRPELGPRLTGPLPLCWPPARPPSRQHRKRPRAPCRLRRVRARRASGRGAQEGSQPSWRPAWGRGGAARLSRD